MARGEGPAAGRRAARAHCHGFGLECYLPKPVTSDALLASLGAPIKCFGSSMSMGVRVERVLAHRLAELERLVLDQSTPELWQEYYVVADLWWRVRAPVPTTPPTTMGMLKERFAQKADGR